MHSFIHLFRYEKTTVSALQFIYTDLIIFSTLCILLDSAHLILQDKYLHFYWIVQALIMIFFLILLNMIGMFILFHVIKKTSLLLKSVSGQGMCFLVNIRSKFWRVYAVEWISIWKRRKSFWQQCLNNWRLTPRFRGHYMTLLSVVKITIGPA